MNDKSEKQNRAEQKEIRRIQKLTREFNRSRTFFTRRAVKADQQK